MNADTKLLNEIYHGAVNAVTIISAVLADMEEGTFFDVLFDEMTQYRKIANCALMLINDFGLKIEEEKPYEKFSLMTAKRIILRYHDKEKLCAMLSKGSAEEIRELVECVNTCTAAGTEARKLAYTMIEAEEENIRKLKSKV